MLFVAHRYYCERNENLEHLLDTLNKLPSNHMLVTVILVGVNSAYQSYEAIIRETTTAGNGKEFA
jgi:hypothetical protein